ncbi:HrpB1 family type III secretion system apparatus protein [Mycetohabitans sp. B2]|jgi:type III secretion protein HrpB1|uniref:HrpB1 family type III secretion system apparatus protein n=1 Tax=Mycetohabitans sp. B2 TaxID=2841274 RepID=UPI001F2919DC|nr:HrpB1 family type III secretion system apparatus protein [Mycetohabitans sp. B2]MCF7697514.1 HrpB1 family type III secretion system apparatus protein [Mycetohabitans sp. B2]
MSISSQQYLKVDKHIVGGLIEVVSTFLQDNFSPGAGNTEDAELVVDALRVVRPGVREFGALEGMLLMSRGRWDEAIDVLELVLRERPKFLYAKALLALALFSRGDSTWRQLADEIDDSDAGEDSRSLVRALRARADLHAAMETYHKTGKFTLPESCATQMQELEQQNAASSSSEPANVSTEFIPSANFLRL